MANFVAWANNPNVKGELKNVFNVGILICGTVVIVSELKKRINKLVKKILHITKNPSVSNSERQKLSCKKIVVLVSKIAIVGTFCSTKQAHWVIGKIATGILSPQAWEAIVGPNINFEGNRLHPRHVVSITSFVLGVPAIVYSIWLMCNKDRELDKGREGGWIKNRTVIYLTAIATLLSRTFQHVANAFARNFVR